MSRYDNNHFQAAKRSHLHVHVDSSSRDCDGPLDRSYVILPEPDESAEAFFLRWMSSLCGTTSEVTFEEDGSWEAHHHYPTEEGYHAEQHRSCVWLHCRNQEYRQRDYYAERMGY